MNEFCWLISYVETDISVHGLDSLYSLHQPEVSGLTDNSIVLQPRWEENSGTGRLETGTEMALIRKLVPIVRYKMMCLPLHCLGSHRGQGVWKQYRRESFEWK